MISKGSSDRWRLIVNMSAPAGAEINDGIHVSELASSLCYVHVSVANAVHNITSQGQSGNGSADSHVRGQS